MLKKIIFNSSSLIGIFRCSYDNALVWIPRNLNEKSVLLLVMVWCRQATSHYLNQCWTRSILPYGVTRPQWVHRQAWVYCKSNSQVSVNKPLQKTWRSVLIWVTNDNYSFYIFFWQKSCFLVSLSKYVYLIDTLVCMWIIIDLDVTFITIRRFRSTNILYSIFLIHVMFHKM